MQFINEFIAFKRNQINASTEKISNGLCYLSALNKIENQKISADKLLFDTILQRLGVNESFFEHYITDYDYCLQNLRFEIIDKIEHNQHKNANNLLNVYKKKADMKNSLHVQYVEYAKLLMQKDIKNPSEAYKKMIKITVPAWENGPLKKLFLSDMEVFFFLKYALSLYEENHIEFCFELLDFLQQQPLESSVKIRCYIKLICTVSDNLIQNKKYKTLLNLCDKAIKIMQEKNELYNFTTVLNLKMRMLTELCIKNDEYNSISVWHDTLLEFYKDFNVNPNDDFLLSYKFSVWQDCYHIADVIKQRRKMLHISQEKLAHGICDFKTVSRIENKRTNPHPKIAQKLLEKLNLTGDLYSDNIKTNNAEVSDLCVKATLFLRRNEYKKARENFKICKKNLT